MSKTTIQITLSHGGNPYVMSPAIILPECTKVLLREASAMAIETIIRLLYNDTLAMDAIEEGIQAARAARI